MDVMDLLGRSLRRRCIGLALGAMATVAAAGPASALEIESSGVVAPPVGTTLFVVRRVEAGDLY